MYGKSSLRLATDLKERGDKDVRRVKITQIFNKAFKLY